jgi:hypothetical protein
MNLLIDKDFAQALLNYLADRPYKEVFQFIIGMQQLKEEKAVDSDVKE